jgi:hypothetical protein
MAAGYPGPGEQQAPYPEYQAWHPQGAPGGYLGPAGYGEAVDPGDYAYVIHDAAAMAPAPPQSRPRERGQGLGAWSPANAGHPAGAEPQGKPADAAGTPTVAVRAITAGAGNTRRQATRVSPSEAASSAAATPTPAATAPTAAATGDAVPAEPAVQADTVIPASAAARARTESAADVDPAMAYGPDDPAYGPPGPDWYKRREQGESWAEDAKQQQPDDEEAPVVRGPFEPLRSGERDASGAAEYQPADDESPFDGDDGLLSLDDEMPDLLDFGTPSDPEAGTLGQIKDLYLTADTISPASLDRHFDQLLERQRQLISEYFKESGGVSLAEPVLPEPQAAQEDQPASSIPFGFDSAASLSSLRDDLRSAQ